MKKNKLLKNFLLLVIFCAPLYLVKVNIFIFPSNVFEILALLSSAYVFIKKRSVIFKKIAQFPKSFLLSLFLIITGIVFSVLFNGNFTVGFGILKGWFLVPFFFSFALYLMIDSSTSLEAVFKSIYFSTVAVGLVAIFYKLFNLLTYDERLTAFYSSPNYLALYLAPGIFFGLFFFCKQYSQNKLSKQTLFYLLTLLLISISLYFTYSYGAWMAILLSLLLTRLVLQPIKKQFFALIVLLLFFFALFASQIGTQKLSAALSLSTQSSFASRIMIWKSSLLLITQHPLVGIGAGNFQAAYLNTQPYFPPYLEWAVPQPHNIFLAFWLQAGLAGLTGFLWLLFFIFKTFSAIFKNKKNAAFAAPLFGFFLYTILHGMLDTTYWKNDLSFLFWICFFLLLVLAENSKKETF